MAGIKLSKSEVNELIKSHVLENFPEVFNEDNPIVIDYREGDRGHTSYEKNDWEFIIIETVPNQNETDEAPF